MPWVSVHVMSKHRYHILVGVLIKVMGFVAPVEDVGHIVGWRRVNDSRRNYVGHIAVISILGYP